VPFEDLHYRITLFFIRPDGALNYGGEHGPGGEGAKSFGLAIYDCSIDQGANKGSQQKCHEDK
jgi:hypothetical protein